MKIKKISCEQFAGLQDCSVELNDGINVIFGRNESGKSTLVNLLSRTLFQSSKIKMNSKDGKDFKLHYYPVPCKDSVAGDYVDGSVTLEANDGTYTIARTWGVGAQEKLSTPSGKIKDSDTINEILRQHLTYGEGVYRDILLTSQYEAAQSLDQLLKPNGAESTKQELLLSASNAFAESDGITLASIEGKIQEKISEIQGKNWDATQSIPRPNRQNARWQKDMGKILPAFYEREDAQKALNKLHELEDNLDQANASFREAGRLLEEATQNRDRFEQSFSLLEKQDELKKNVQLLQINEKNYQAAAEQWPKDLQNFTLGSALRQQLQQRNLLDLYSKAKEIRGKLLPLQSKLQDRYCPQDSEIDTVMQADHRITTLQNQLCGMNLAAQLSMLDGHIMEVTSLRTGKPLDTSSGTFPINEAVLLRIPGVMELQLAPANVNVTELNQKIDEYTQRRQEILDCYQVTSAQALEDLAKAIQKDIQEANKLNDRLNELLGEHKFEDLEAEVQEFPSDIPDAAALHVQIRELCQGQTLDTFLGACQSKLSNYEQQFETPDALSVTLSDTQTVLQEKKKALESCQEIPQEYSCIADPQTYKTELSGSLETCVKNKEEALNKKAKADQELETYRDSIVGDPNDNLEKACQEFESQKEALSHWLHIQQVFEQQKEQVRNNPVQDIADHFARYLSLLSGGTVSTEFPEFGKMEMNIYSKNRNLTYATLSEGTKETVSLAFRLAVLDHLFPDGGGILVLDDPFTDMDAQRTAQACTLVQDCAQRHQILIMTCHEDYCSLLGGNRIDI